MYTVYLKVHGQRDIANLMIKTLCKSQLYDRELSAENHGAFSSLHHGIEVGIKKQCFHLFNKPFLGQFS